MKLDKEQIIKGIESLIKALKSTKGWWGKRGRGGWFNHQILEDAHALIRELTEENERYKRYYLNHEYNKMEAEIRAETVRKMQTLIENGSVCFVATSNGIEMNRTYQLTEDRLCQIAKELLEGN